MPEEEELTERIEGIMVKNTKEEGGSRMAASTVVIISNSEYTPLLVADIKQSISGVNFIYFSVDSLFDFNINDRDEEIGVAAKLTRIIEVSYSADSGARVTHEERQSGAVLSKVAPDQWILVIHDDKFFKSGLSVEEYFTRLQQIIDQSVEIFDRVIVMGRWSGSIDNSEIRRQLKDLSRRYEESRVVDVLSVGSIIAHSTFKEALTAKVNQ